MHELDILQPAHATPPPGFDIRPVQPSDNPFIAQIIRDVMTEFGCVGEGYSINDAEVDTIYESYNDGRSIYFIISKDGEIVGGGGIGPLANGDPEICELKKMYFVPAARGYGLGRYLVTLLLDHAKILGYRQCYLETVERMTQANQLYRKMGFEKLCGNMGDTGHCSCDSYYVRAV